MGNVNSEDTGGGAVAPVGGGGATRVRQLPDEQVGRGLWAKVGTAVVVVTMLAVPVWILVSLAQYFAVLGGDSAIVWVYASVFVLVVACAFWFLYRIIRQQQGEDPRKGGSI